MAHLLNLRYNVHDMKGKIFTKDDVTHIANLANIPVTTSEKQKLADGFTATMNVVDQLFSADVQFVEPTHQVTGLENILRVDEVDIEHQVTQDQALVNAPRTYNGYFVTDQVIEEK